jgi:hypothetical protein
MKNHDESGRIPETSGQDAGNLQPKRKIACPTYVKKTGRNRRCLPPRLKRYSVDLVKESFIDEHRYARAYVNDKCRLQGCGPG